jgi:NADPH-dependent 2,4-dienoyl-CoA reductase/sulfur reductase-like enzyme
VVRRAEVFRSKQGIDLHTGHQVESIDPKRRKVAGTTLDGREFEQGYDRLLIATGASVLMPDLPGFDLPRVLPLKTLQDGRRMKRLLNSRNIKKVALIGMGYIAMEMCETLKALDIDVAMVKPNPEFLPWLATDLADVVRDEIATNGVGIHAGHEPERIEPSGDRVRLICADLELSVDMVLVAIGVQPESELARSAGLQLSVADSIAVDRQLHTSDENVYSAGDCADAYHVVTGEKTWIPLALRANRAGWAVADNVCGQAKTLDGVAGTSVFRVFEMEVARTGLNVTEAEKHGFEPVEMTIKGASRAHTYGDSSPLYVSAVADKKSGRLLGMQIVGREGAAHRINAPAVALHMGMTVAAYTQTDLAYAPPFGPTWDPTLIAANQLAKKI